MDNIYKMSNLQDLVRSGEKDFSKYGDVKVIQNENLLLFNYTIDATFKNRWNYFETISRGLILDTSGNIVARPFSKFFNWGERTTDANLVEATEKMDGSLGIAYIHNGLINVATRGSFDSEQAQYAAQWLIRKLYTSEFLDFLDTYTLLFEIIYPENRIVVNYGDREDLVLIGAIDKKYGIDLYYRELEVIADNFDLSLPKYYTFNSISDILNESWKLSANEEGWVARFTDGQRFKVKGEAYRLAHKMMTRVSFKDVLEADRQGLRMQLIAGIPDEFLSKVKDWTSLIDEKLYSLSEKTERVFDDAPKETRKEFALYVKDKFPEGTAYCFAKLDGHDYIPLIYKGAFKDLNDEL